MGKILFSLKLIGLLLLLITYTACEDDVLLEDMESSSSGGSYGKLKMDNDSLEAPDNYLYDKENEEIY